MRAILAITLLVVSATLSASQSAAGDAAFLAGCWSFERNGRTVAEQWMAPAGGSLIGMSRTVAGGKTTEFEFLQIRETPGGLAYIAKPSNQPEATFMLTAKTADSLTFENPSHDFPQRISYRRQGDTLTARVEGTLSGKPRAIDFPYQRTPCVP